LTVTVRKNLMESGGRDWLSKLKIWINYASSIKKKSELLN
jgi:hypothetical protein